MKEKEPLMYSLSKYMCLLVAHVFFVLARNDVFPYYRLNVLVGVLSILSFIVMWLLGKAFYEKS